MCEYLEISRSAYYKWNSSKRILSISKVDQLKSEIKQIWKENRMVYGSPKITKVLARRGKFYHSSYIARLMRVIGISGLRKKRYVVTTDSKHNYTVSENILDRKFQVNELGKVWVSDITYIKCNNDWLYLTSIIDLADRKVIGWSLSEDMTTKNTVYKAWIRARNSRSITSDFIFHSDRGVQYASQHISNLFLYNRKMNQSMSRKGNCWDNAVAESFFKSLKCELVYRTKFDSFLQAELEIREYINWYNNKRIHQSLNYLTPLEKERNIKRNLDKRAA